MPWGRGADVTELNKSDERGEPPEGLKIANKRPPPRQFRVFSADATARALWIAF